MIMFSGRYFLFLLLVFNTCAIRCISDFGSQKTFQRFYDNLLPSDVYVICRMWNGVVSTQLDCSRKCLAYQWCHMFVYDVINDYCSLYCDLGLEDNLKMNEETILVYVQMPETGMKGFPCTSSTQCLFDHSVCNRGICSCALGYNYNPSNNTCNIGCSEYGQDFTLYDDVAISWHNDFVIEKVGLSACWDLCAASSSCLTLEYFNSARRCNLQSVGWFDVSRDKQIRDVQSRDLSMSVKHCDV